MSIWEEIFMLAQLKHKTKELGLHSFAPELDFLLLRSNAKAISLTSSWTTAEAENCCTTYAETAGASVASS